MCVRGDEQHTYTHPARPPKPVPMGRTHDDKLLCSFDKRIHTHTGANPPLARPVQQKQSGWQMLWACTTTGKPADDEVAILVPAKSIDTFGSFLSVGLKRAEPSKPKSMLDFARPDGVSLPLRCSSSRLSSDG